MLILVGESASGKSTIEKELVKLGYNKIVSYTSRPLRDGEVNGIDYNFISKEKFEELKQNSFFAEVGEYRGWYYGSAKDDCTNDKVAVLTPHGLRQMKSIDGLDITSFYINVPRRDRLIKILQRGDNIEECYRRSLSDVGQFDGIEDEVDYVIENDGYSKTPMEIATIIHVLTKAKDGANEIF
jgi:guanylate kinase